MVKAYLRYEFAGAFGVISSNSNVVYDNSGNLLITAALENISVYNIKQATQVQLLAPPTPSSSSGSGASASVAEVTALACAPTGSQLAAGYSDGVVRLWDLTSGECIVSLQGHKGAVTALRYSRCGGQLASGSQDTDVILWDVAAEAGLVRLRGHKDQVTDVVLLSGLNKLVSCSKDGALRVWALDTQHCCQVLPLCTAGGAWSLDVDLAERRLVAGCADAELRVFDVQQAAASGGGSSVAAAPAAAALAGGAHEVLRAMGAVRRQCRERVAAVRYDASNRLLAVLSAGKSVELFRVRADEEAKKKMKRRRKRRKEKAAAKAAKAAAGAVATGSRVAAAAEGDSDSDGDGGAQEGMEAPSASDELEPLMLVTSKHKIRSIAFPPPGAAAGRQAKDRLAQMALGLSNNSIELVDVAPSSYDVVGRIEQGGHRSDVRALALTADDSLLLSTSNAGAKLWNPSSGACLGSVEAGYGLCAVFAPGGRHAVIGTKEGTLQVVDVGACSVVHTEAAHSGPVWSLALLPDRSGFVSGSADKTIRFWTWALMPSAAAAAGDTPGGGGGGGARHVLGLQQSKVLEMAEDVLCVRVSPDGRLLAAALLDSTIRVYYADSLKFFLSLYGHKLPVLCMDISSDGTLLASGGADKNIKVWGLDFGDCHRSLFAHGDAITALSFVPGTHYAFSAGKDRMVKYWDLDRFELLLELPGHHAEVRTLAVSAYGDTVLSGSHDRSIRRWERTSEPFFVEEEKERRLESLFEADLAQQERRDDAAAAAGAGDVVGGGGGGSAAAAGRKTMESVSAADGIIDALDMAAHEEEKQREAEAEAAAAAAGGAGGEAAAAAAKRPPPNPLMLGLDPGAFVLRSVAAVRSNDLEQALLLLPFSDALRLLAYLSDWLQQGRQVELCVRAATLLLRLHHSQLTATPGARQALLTLHGRMRGALQGLKDTLGFNIHAMRHLQRAAKAEAAVDEGAAVSAARRQLGVA